MVATATQPTTTAYAGPPAVHPASVGDPMSMVIEGISWETYERLLDDRGESRWPRYAYFEGWLEIVSPRASHDQDSSTLSHLVLIIAEEFGVEDLRATGGFTYKSEPKRAGFEPDSGFYLGRVAELGGKRELEGPDDPPPDLIIEVDVTHSSEAKLPLLAKVGVNEVWRVRGGKVSILRRDPSVGFEEVVESGELRGITPDILNGFLADRLTMEWLHWVRSVRTWAREQARPA